MLTHSFTTRLVAIFVLFLSGKVIDTNALYEDQIRKFDWRSQHIGGLQQAHLELNGFQPRLLLRTRENVIASVCPKSGDLVWRQVFEQGPRGDIKLMHINSASDDVSTQTATVRANSNQGFDVLTVQGSAPSLVRGWNVNTGTIEWEWSLLPLQAEHAESALWLYKNSLLHHIVPVWQSHLEVTQYFAVSGQAIGNSQRISAPWIKSENCLLIGNYFVCLEGQQLVYLDVMATQPKVLRKPLANLPKSKPMAMQGTDGVLVIDGKLVSLTDEKQISCSHLESNSFLLAHYNQRAVLLRADVNDNFLHIAVNYADNCEEIPQLAQRVPYSKTSFGKPTLRAYDCKSKRNNDGKSCLFVLDTADDVILAVQQSKIRWLREEALANVIATEFIDLPLADSEGALEKEMKDKAGDLLTAFVRRISTQVLQVKSLVMHLMGLGAQPSETQKAGLVRDAFGLHKMLVVLTRSGKIFGIDNINGKHHWTYYLANAANFNNDEEMKLIVQRTSKHFPLLPLCTIVAKHEQNGKGLLYSFNPITGEPAEGGLKLLNYAIKQLSVLPEANSDFVKGLLLMDESHKVHVHPEHASDLALGMYIYTADKSRAEMIGYFITRNLQGHLDALPVWDARFTGTNGQHKIISLAGKNPLEHVHSQGRVLSDRSVLYKYNNPNLVAVITQGPDSIHKYALNVYLLDVVSGSVVFSMAHRKARGPVHIVHSENWLTYSFYNDKVRRSEISTIELYEGKTQANGTFFSSLNAPQMPHVERQTYIIPATVQTMRETITERGITNKDVLIGISTGAIVELPWVLLDPRRPTAPTTQAREEGVIPYMPELPLHTESLINYNQTLLRLNRIYTAPSGLESTSLVVATGLDMFVTRVAPSKTFDQLKEDFDYILICVVLAALTSSSLIVKHLASRKLIKQAWK